MNDKEKIEMLREAMSIYAGMQSIGIAAGPAQRALAATAASSEVAGDTKTFEQWVMTLPDGVRRNVKDGTPSYTQLAFQAGRDSVAGDAQPVAIVESWPDDNTHLGISYLVPRASLPEGTKLYTAVPPPPAVAPTQQPDEDEFLQWLLVYSNFTNDIWASLLRAGCCDAGKGEIERALEPVLETIAAKYRALVTQQPTAGETRPGVAAETSVRSLSHAELQTAVNHCAAKQVNVVRTPRGLFSHGQISDEAHRRTLLAVDPAPIKQPEPVVLTDEQILAIQLEHIPERHWSTNGIGFARAIIAATKGQP